MRKLDEARNLLEEFGMPKAQCSDICCLTLWQWQVLRRNDRGEKQEMNG